ncbi:hypothetical protein KIW84_040864 [Lathyrus oleraceus]|uniref:Uncharacterized protein n=1 Tax=Pisum sativum TaxID=3888 RepID=A0A9D4XBG3_PEA|nr:hypothetical protein KIW84_040864 [Pisum sativum]
MKGLQKEDGTIVTTLAEIEMELLDFYSTLMGRANENLDGIDVPAMRDKAQLNFDQRHALIVHVTDQEILKALKGIGDLKAPSMDGFGSKFFKASWNIVREDVIVVVRDFFVNDMMYKAMNIIVVTLIPKSDGAKTIRDYISITCCTNVYKIILKVLTNRLGKVPCSIVSQNQTAFVQGQHIHNHISWPMSLLKDTLGKLEHLYV